MAEKRSLLDLISTAGSNTWLGSAMNKGIAGPPDPYYRPTRRLMGKHSDEDLAELIAERSSTAEAELARSIMRRREAWRTPATPALIISVLSFGLAAWAFARTI